MKSYLIQDTTEEERRKIVEESLGFSSGMCDECASGIADMYDDYIYGKRELKEITMSFRTSYVTSDNRADRSGCGM